MPVQGQEHLVDGSAREVRKVVEQDGGSGLIIAIEVFKPCARPHGWRTSPESRSHQCGAFFQDGFNI
ncbi:hypothetical protein CBM2598_P310031 [Cupriavidus taiwanensis]|nr:hypothetical protein CBM2597_P340027 [Cupriavidus taiwanensis]SOZ95939.1 hypothetical protein CBM2598_P310031 [Cupriavidus taiwanensis]